MPHGFVAAGDFFVHSVFLRVAGGFGAKSEHGFVERAAGEQGLGDACARHGFVVGGHYVAVGDAVAQLARIQLVQQAVKDGDGFVAPRVVGLVAQHVADLLARGGYAHLLAGYVVAVVNQFAQLRAVAHGKACCAADALLCIEQHFGVALAGYIAVFHAGEREAAVG